MQRWQIDLRMAAAGLLAAAAALTVLLVTSPAPTVDVLVAGSPLPAGVPLDDLDVEVRPVSDGSGLVAAASHAALGDHLLVAPLGAGSPIPESLLVDADQPGGQDLMGLDLEAAAAVQGRLEPGDRVDVYAVGERVERLAEAVSVVAVDVDSSALGSARVHLLLAVDAQTVGPLVAATSGQVHLVRRGS